MRIKAFKYIIRSEGTEEHSLRNCSVVIDGQNYLHNMYENSKIPFVFGCETDKYAEYVRDQFEKFKKANVKCYIVFKGGDTDINNKIQKFERLIFNVNEPTFIPPVLLKDANEQVIDEMGVDYAFCVTESKYDCVALAQQLQCPVVSNDIEFCFKNTPYIPFLQLNFNSETNSIQCRRYELQNFLRKHSLTPEKFAIFGTLTDTTVFPEHYFDRLFQNWRVLNKNLEVTQLRYLIFRLSKHGEEEVRQEISKTLLNGDDLDKFWSNYNNILKKMGKHEAGHVTENLLNRNVSIVKQDTEWFEKGVVCKHVPPVYINLFKSKFIEGSWLILDTQSEDRLLLSINIVKYAYNLLTNYKRDIIKVYQDANKYIEIDTDDPNIRRPRYECSVSVFENGWDEMKHLKLFEHFLAENNIDIEVLAEAELPEDSVVFLIALVYFARKKQLKGEDVTNEVYAVVLSYIVLNVTLYTGVSSKDLVNVKQVTNKYYQYDEDEAKCIFNGTVSNRFVELQYCIQHMNYLNVLCGSPFKSSKYSRIYNGTFIFKIFRDMRGHNCDDFVNDLFKSTPRILEEFKRLIQVYRKLL